MSTVADPHYPQTLTAHFCVTQDFVTADEDPLGGRSVEDLFVMRASSDKATDIDMNFGDLGAHPVPIGAVKDWCKFFGIQVRFGDPDEGYRYSFTITDPALDFMFRMRFGLRPSGS